MASVSYTHLDVYKRQALLRPKFELVLRMFEEQLREPGVAQWTNPRGGYFITCQVPEGCAKKVVQLCAEAGVILTLSLIHI